MSGGKIGHSEEMNERPKLGTGEGGVNDCFWVISCRNCLLMPLSTKFTLHRRTAFFSMSMTVVASLGPEKIPLAE